MRTGGLRQLFRGGSRLLPAQDAYALWADTYPPNPHNPLMECEQAAVAPIIASSSVVRALDLGTGTGRYLPLLASAGARVVVGIDLSVPMLLHKENWGERVCADACRLPFRDASFNVVCSSLMAGDVEDPSRWLLEAARVLTPGGQLVFSDFHPSWILQGWRRTFRTRDGRLWELPFFPHTIAQHLLCLEKAGLTVRTISEPRMDDGELPAVVVFDAVKPGPLPALGR